MFVQVASLVTNTFSTCHDRVLVCYYFKQVQVKQVPYFPTKYYKPGEKESCTMQLNLNGENTTSYTPKETFSELLCWHVRKAMLRGNVVATRTTKDWYKDIHQLLDDITICMYKDV